MTIDTRNVLSGLDPIEELIAAARLAIMNRDAFLGNLIARMSFIEDITGKIKTMGTDGVRVYYNREFIRNMNFPQLVFVLGHEVVHALADHVSRGGNRDRDLWNVAIDAYTNALLIQMKLGEMPRNGIYYKEFDDLDKWAAESIYDKLLENGEKAVMPLDDHLELVEDGDSGSENDSDEEGGNQVRVNVIGQDGEKTEIGNGDLEEIRRQLQDNILAACHAAAGSMNGTLERLVDAFLKPKVDWRGLLIASIRSLVKTEQSYTVYNKRSGEIIFPGNFPENAINAVIYIDGSGSIDADTLKLFLTEVHGIMTQFPHYKIHLAGFDTKVSGYSIYTPENAENLPEWKMAAGGGTDYGCFWKHLSTLDIQDDFTTIILTDGQPSDAATWNKKDIPYNVSDIVFILQGAPRTIRPPYGRWAHID